MTGNPAKLHGRGTAGGREVFLAKPFGPATLVATVRELVGRSAR